MRERIENMLKSALAIAIALSCGVSVVGEQALAAPARLNSQSHITLNPQPLPPCTCGQVRQVSPGDLVTLNPQPLPPRISNGPIASGIINPEG
jgi:hypothetical protein